LPPAPIPQPFTAQSFSPGITVAPIANAVLV
jgi:hypothetical protein